MAAGYVGTPRIVKLALGDGTDSVILSNISEGVDGATPTPITISPIGEFNFEDGQYMASGREWSLTMSGMVSDFTDAGVAGTLANGRAKLLEWAQNQTLVEVAGIAMGGYGFSTGDNNTDYYISSCQKYTASGGRVYMMVTIKRSGLDGTTSGIRNMETIGANIIDGKYEWTSVNGTNPVGLAVRTVTGLSAETFAGSTYSLTYSTSGDAIAEYRMFFPFVGVNISLAVTFGTVAGTAVTSNQVRILEYDYADVSGSIASAVVSASSTITATATLSDTDLYSVGLRIINAVGGVSGAGVVAINAAPSFTINSY